MWKLNQKSGFNSSGGSPCAASVCPDSSGPLWPETGLLSRWSGVFSLCPICGRCSSFHTWPTLPSLPLQGSRNGRLWVRVLTRGSCLVFGVWGYFWRTSEHLARTGSPRRAVLPECPREKHGQSCFTGAGWGSLNRQAVNTCDPYCEPAPFQVLGMCQGAGRRGPTFLSRELIVGVKYCTKVTCMAPVFTARGLGGHAR